MATRYDGFIGSMLAAESVLDGTTLLHGPGGCRNTSAGLSDRYLNREFSTDPRDFFMDRSRIACTFVDSYDYIYGSADKVDLVLDAIRDSRFAVLLESPGASLIGDRLWDRAFEKGMADNVAIIGKCYMSEPFSVGFDRVLTAVCSKLAEPRDKDLRAVNVIGVPFISRGCDYLLDEIHWLLGLMGLRTIADIGSGCTVDQIRESSSACANVCIMPEYCGELSAWYEDALGIPTVVCPLGAPVGFSALRALIIEVGRTTGADPTPALERIDACESRVTERMRNALTMAERLRGRTYSVEAESSVAQALVGFMAEWFRMAPQAVSVVEEDAACMDALKASLDGIGCSEALGMSISGSYADVMIGPGSKVRMLEAQRLCRTGIDASLPSQDSVDLMPKSIMGMHGALMLLDRVANSMICDDGEHATARCRCGRP